MYRILIADDEPIERVIVSRKITKFFSEQLEVVLAENGRAAVELFEKEKCKIAILDIEMPGINGLKAAKMIREKDKECPIIFLTAFDEFGYAKKAISVKALDYLLKPSEDNELIAVLEEAIRLVQENEARMEASVKGNALGIKDLVQDNVANDEEISNENVKLNAVAHSIKKYIQEHYKEDIALQDVAGAMNYSDAYFCKIFKQCFDKSFIVYLMEFRIEKAKELLGDVVINIKDVSAEVGYKDSHYFAKVFKRAVGVTPSEYRILVLKNKVQS